MGTLNMATQTIGPVATPSLVKTTLWILLATIITLVIMVACAYLWVYVYSAFIHTTGDAAFYEAYAQRASPVVAVVVAFPVFFVMGRFMRGLGARATMAALTVVAISLVLDVASVATMASDPIYHGIASILSFIAKFAGAYFGSKRTA